MKEISDNVTTVTLHDSQALIQIINANVTYCAWARGSGKTSGGIGPRFMHLSEVMPRSQVLLFSDTYDRLKKRIVPGLISFLQHKLGYKEGEDYVLYKKPPAHFVQPFIIPGDYEHVISFATGMCACLVSLRIEGSANAYNAQAAIGDEVKFCDEEQINTEVLPAIRGEQERYGHLPEYLSVWMFTDKYGPKIKWYLEKRDKVNKKAIEVVYAMQMKIFEWQAALRDAKSLATEYKYRKLIDEYSKKCNEIRKHLVYFSEMKPYENLHTLGEMFFKRAKKLCKTEEMYNVAFLNHDPGKIENSFYSTLSDANYYGLENDVDPLKPLIISLDYNWRIVPMSVAQIATLPGKSFPTLNTVAAFHAVHPQEKYNPADIHEAVGDIPEVVEIFTNYFLKHKHQINRTVYYVYDSTAIGRRIQSEQYNVMVRKALIKAGWNVVDKYIGQAPTHGARNKKFKEWFKERGELSVMINKLTTIWLQKSVNQAGAKTSANITKKDKSTETDNNFPAKESTHHSEAWDHILWAVKELKIISPGVEVSTGIRIG